MPLPDTANVEEALSTSRVFQESPKGRSGGDDKDRLGMVMVAVKCLTTDDSAQNRRKKAKKEKKMEQHLHHLVAFDQCPGFVHVKSEGRIFAQSQKNVHLPKKKKEEEREQIYILGVFLDYIGRPTDSLSSFHHNGHLSAQQASTWLIYSGLSG